MTAMRVYEQSWPEGEYRFFQMGFVVDDLVATAGRWAAVHGVGPFHVLPPLDSPCIYRGEATGVKVQIAVAQAGPVQIELIEQQCERPSVFREIAVRGSSGFHQVCTVTSDYEGKKAYYEGLGYVAASEIEGPGGQRVAYMDTFDDFGFFTEIVASSPMFLDQLAGISRTCAEWDGVTDPVRLLTRDGYRVP